jgi:hypothetical protein
VDSTTRRVAVTPKTSSSSATPALHSAIDAVLAAPTQASTTATFTVWRAQAGCASENARPLGRCAWTIAPSRHPAERRFAG